MITFCACGLALDSDPEQIRKMSILDTHIIPTLTKLDEKISSYEMFQPHLEKAYQTLGMTEGLIPITKDRINQTKCGCPSCGFVCCLKCAKEQDMKCKHCKDSSLIRGQVFSQNEEWTLVDEFTKFKKSDDKLKTLGEIYNNWIDKTFSSEIKSKNYFDSFFEK